MSHPKYCGVCGKDNDNELITCKWCDKCREELCVVHTRESYASIFHHGQLKVINPSLRIVCKSCTDRLPTH